jgi:hypothetical protein
VAVNVVVESGRCPRSVHVVGLIERADHAVAMNVQLAAVRLDEPPERLLVPLHGPHRGVGRTRTHADRPRRRRSDPGGAGVYPCVNPIHIERTTMAPNTALDIALAYHHAWTSGDMDAAISYVGDDVVFDAPPNQRARRRALRDP